MAGGWAELGRVARPYLASHGMACLPAARAAVCVWRRPECVLLLCRCGGSLPNRAWGELSWMAAMHINTH